MNIYSRTNSNNLKAKHAHNSTVVHSTQSQNVDRRKEKFEVVNRESLSISDDKKNID
jgi:hypothetical protein